MQSQQQTPFNFLASLEGEIHRCAKGLPYHETSADNWVGVSFLSGCHVLLTPLEEVVEIMRVPELAPVPGVKPWLRGMVTCRGELFPVTELNGLLTKKISTITHYSRILVINNHEEYSGILVDRVLGLQRIASQDRRTQTQLNVAELTPFIIGAFINEHVELPIISCKAIMQHPSFRDVALREDEIIEVED